MDETPPKSVDGVLYDFIPVNGVLTLSPIEGVSTRLSVDEMNLSVHVLVIAV